MKNFAHRLLNKLGIEVRLIRNLKAAHLAAKRDQEVNAWRVLEHHDFAIVLDIGANEGQFATMARRLWPKAVVHAFEPLPDVYATLVENFRNDPLLVPHNVALAAESGTQVMHCSAFSPSSSLLPMADLHRKEWPQSAVHRDVEVRLLRLDDWARENDAEDRLCGPMLVKIDVQGFELSVLAGGEATLRAADFAVLEVSFYELYEGQPLFAQIHARMTELGFMYRGNIEQFASKDGTRVLFADAIFENLRRTESRA